MVIDFYNMRQHINAVIDAPCDHQDLNLVYPEMLTTAENLATTWLQALRQRDVRYTAVKVWETSTASATASVR